MISRFSDLRVKQAIDHGSIVGMPPDEAQRIALIADLITVCVHRRDLVFLRAELGREASEANRVRVDARWTLLFDWVDGLGATNIRLE